MLKVIASVVKTDPVTSNSIAVHKLVPNYSSTDLDCADYLKGAIPVADTRLGLQC